MQSSCANTLECNRRSSATATTNKNKDNRQSLKITFQKTSTQNGTSNKNAEELNYKTQQYLGSNNDISITLKSGSSTPKRILYLPGEDTLSLNAQVPFGNASLSNRSPKGWKRVQTFLQYDEPTRKLWEKLQKPYGNLPSFIRHLLLLEKYFREEDLMVTSKANSNLPGEDTLSLNAQVSFGNASLSSRSPEGWTRVQTFLQYDEPTRKLWEKLQKPYGNQSSFIRHLLLLEKYFREEDLMLTSKANSNAMVYTNAIQNRLKAYYSMAKDGYIQDSSFETTNKKARVGENDFPIQLSSSIIITLEPKLPVDALKDNSLKSHLLQGNTSGIEILPISSSKQNTSKQNVSVTGTVTSQSYNNNVEKLNSSNNNSNAESTNSQSVPSSNNKQPQANISDSKQESSNQQEQSSNQQQQSSNQQQEQSPNQRQQSPNQRQQSPNQPHQKSSNQPQQQEAQQNIQQQKQQPQQSLLNQSQQKSLQNKPNVSTNNKGNVNKESYRPNIIVLPDTLSPYERANSKNWRPTLITLTKEAYKNQPDKLYQTIDGRLLPGLVQIQDGGKPYLISVYDYNKMCILRTENF